MLKLFNTLTRTKETFEPQTPPTVTLYTCGPTVYSRAHIGNFRAYLVPDILKRTLYHLGWDVKHIMNITDVGHLTGDSDDGEDKMVKAAKEERKTAWDIAKEYEGWFKKDLADLGITPPTQYVRATDHIADQIALIQILEKKKFTYKLPDGIYFRTDKLPSYGDFAKLDVAGLKEGARVKKTKGKKSPTDFALWKFSPKGTKRDMEWDSPWGVGFPGWHIECSAMSEKYLGVPFDIHTGGVDHIPIHHTNEIAQTVAATGKPLARFWLHNEFLKMHDEKMAKSLGNVLSLDTLREEKISPMAYRYYLLTTHYRQAIDYSLEAVQAAQAAYERLAAWLEEAESPSGQCAEFEQKFFSAIQDDLNTPQGLAIIWEMLKSSESSAAKHASFLSMNKILGLEFSPKEEEDVPQDVLELVSARGAAREEGDFTTADLIRDQILSQGYILKDGANGTTVHKK